MCSETGFLQAFVQRVFEVHVAKAAVGMTYEEFVLFEIAYGHLTVFPSKFFKLYFILGKNIA
jgi:hypothetical protein